MRDRDSVMIGLIGGVVPAVLVENGDGAYDDFTPAPLR
jgi:hypothetical protein